MPTVCILRFMQCQLLHYWISVQTSTCVCDVVAEAPWAYSLLLSLVLGLHCHVCRLSDCVESVERIAMNKWISSREWFTQWNFPFYKVSTIFESPRDMQTQSSSTLRHEDSKIVHWVWTKFWKYKLLMPWPSPSLPFIVSSMPIQQSFFCMFGKQCWCQCLCSVCQLTV